MYKGGEFTGTDLARVAQSKPPFGPGFTPDEVIDAVRLEVWHTSFTDPGEDYTEFRLFNAGGDQVGQRRVEGY
jgi:hypothetical protein